MSIEWITYERGWRGKVSYITCLISEKKPVGGGWIPRTSTDAEIANEIAHRLESDAKNRIRAEFEARQDYQDAKAIVYVLEWIAPDSHPLDKLAPEEWAELRKRLDA